MKSILRYRWTPANSVVRGVCIKGRAEGEAKGKKENQIEIAKKMLEKDIDINLIAELTGLSVEEIEQLKKN